VLHSLLPPWRRGAGSSFSWGIFRLWLWPGIPRPFVAGNFRERTMISVSLFVLIQFASVPLVEPGPAKWISVHKGETPAHRLL